MGYRGRKPSPRSVEILQTLDKATPGEVVKIKLTDHEVTKFLNFYQRVRAMAKRIGKKVKISYPDEETKMVSITIKEDTAEEVEHPTQKPEPKTHPEPGPAEPKPEPYTAAVPPALPAQAPTEEERVEHEASIESDMVEATKWLRALERRIADLGYRTPGSLDVSTLTQALIRAAMLSVRQACDVWDQAIAYDNFESPHA